MIVAETNSMLDTWTDWSAYLKSWSRAGEAKRPMGQLRD